MGVILSTDLSTTFDTVNLEIIIRNFEYYGINGIEHVLISSYYQNRNINFQIETFKS